MPDPATPPPAGAPSVEHTWRGIVARAATPWERLGCPGFRPTTSASAETADARLLAWARALAGGDTAALERLLASRGISAEDLRSAVTDVEVSDESALPAWADDVRRLLATPAPAVPLPPFQLSEVLSGEELAVKGGDPNAAWRLDPVVGPFVAAEREWLAGRIAAGVPASPAVERRLLARLARVVSDVAVHALSARIEAADAAAGAVAPAGGTRLDAFTEDADVLATWAAVWAELPVLARVMAVALRHWRETVAELLARLAADLPLLQETFGGGAPLGRLERCEPGAGDPHDGGRAVVMLTFGGGARVVYKPRDLRVAGVYASLARELNAAGLTPPLHERTVIQRGGYAWEEFVHGEDCADEAAVRRYYRRMGMHARLLQLTGGLDFTCDNVVAVGEHPVLIDLEMLTAPLLEPPAASAAEERAREMAARFPVRSGIVTARIFGEPGRAPAELGALSAGGTRQAPFRQLRPERGEDGQVRMVEEYPFFPTGAAAPRLNGAPVPAAEYLGEVEAGYLEMSRCLRRAAAALDAPAGPLAALAEAPVRFLARDTQIYMRMLIESLRPASLADGVQREIRLERMWKAKFPHPGVVRQEVDSLRVLDVPLFTSRPGTDALDLHGAAPAEGFFQGSALAAIRGRLHELVDSTDDGERNAIRGALAVAAPEHPVPLGAPLTSARPAGDSAERFLDAALGIGNRILDLAFDAGEGPAWAGLHYQPQHDAWHLGLLPDDTLSGTCGLAMLFGDLHRLGAPERFGRTALALGERFAARMEGFRNAPPPAPGAPFCGGLSGWGAWLHALVHGAGASNDGTVRGRALDALAGLPLEQANGAPTDFACGRAGLLAALVALGVPADGPLAGFVADQVQRLTTALTAAWEPGHGAYPAGAHTLSLVPNGRDGVALALARTAAAGLAPLDPVRTWAASMSEAETSGAHLARLATLRLDPTLPGASSMLDAARAFAASVDARAATPDWLEAAEVAIALHAATGDADDLARAREIGGWMLERRAAHGSWFPDRLAPDAINLSAIRGVAALAHLFTRLHAPDRVGSIRVLE